MIRYAFLYFVIGFILFSSCLHTPVVSPNMPEVSFKNDVQPILIGNCTSSGCHAASSGGGQLFSLVTFEDVVNNGGISSGKPEKSKLYKAITIKGENLMPPNGKMADWQISKIYNWIAQGAKNN